MKRHNSAQERNRNSRKSSLLLFQYCILLSWSSLSCLFSRPTESTSSNLDFVHLQLKTGSIEKPIEHGTREQSNSRIMGGCWIALHFPDMESHGSKNIMEGGR